MSRIRKSDSRDVQKVKIIQNGVWSVSTVCFNENGFQKQGNGYIFPQNPERERFHNFFESNSLLDEE